MGTRDRVIVREVISEIYSATQTDNTPVQVVKTIWYYEK